MPTHDPHDPNHPQHPEVGSPGYEVTDVNVNGIVVFLASLAGIGGLGWVHRLRHMTREGNTNASRFRSQGKVGIARKPRKHADKVHALLVQPIKHCARLIWVAHHLDRDFRVLSGKTIEGGAGCFDARPQLAAFKSRVAPFLHKAEIASHIAYTRDSKIDVGAQLAFIGEVDVHVP